MENQEPIVARCVICNSGFTDAEIEGANKCPKCGNRGVPMSPEQDVTVAINWHELRILCIWAENHANRLRNENLEKQGHDGLATVYAIVGRLQEQHPSRTPLTLSAEIAQVREMFGADNVETHGIPEGGPLPPKIS